MKLVAILGDDILYGGRWWKWPQVSILFFTVSGGRRSTRVTLSVSMIRCEGYYHLRSIADLSTPQLFAKHLFGDTRCVFKSFSACPKLLNIFLALICAQPAKFTDCMDALRDVVQYLIR